MTKKILVLDDLYARVEYLIKQLPGVIVLHATNVRTFLSYLDGLIDDPAFAAIILDHDLDMDRYMDETYTAPTDEYGQIILVPKDIYQKDRYGQDGRDAARLLPATGVPVIVWSQNTQDAAEMLQILRDKNHVVNYIKFIPENYDLLTVTIKSIL